MSETEVLPRENDETCRRCGERVGSFRFCLGCGSSLEADELGPADGPDDEGSSRLPGALTWVRRWRTQLVLFPLAAALTIVGGKGAQMLLADIPPPETRTQVTCWDGSTVEEAGACALPTGAKGLRWVFPSFHPNRGRDRCVDVLVEHPEYPRPTMFECDLDVGERRVKVTYIELADVAAGRRYFDRTFAGSDREKVGTAEGDAYRYTWRRTTDRGHELAAMYMDFPFAVTIVARQAVHRDLALRTLEFRHPDKMLVASTSTSSG